MYKKQKCVWSVEFGSDAGSYENPNILEMGPNEHSISD